MNKDEGDEGLLDKPILTQDDNGGTPGVIDISLITGDYVLVYVPPWDTEADGTGPRPYDTYIVYFDENIWTANVVEDEDQAGWPVFPVRFHKGQIPNGSYKVYYTVEDFVGNGPTYSQKADIRIIGASAPAYPAPTFPEFPNGPATFTGIAVERGVVIAAAYPSINNGDVVEFNWSGTNGDGNPVPASQYSFEVQVREGAAQVGGLIPQEYVLCLGPEGTGTAYYHVYPSSDEDGGGDSRPASLELSFADIDSLDVIVSNGAPVQIPGTQGTNQVRLFGRPGMSVYASLVTPSAARIAESGEVNYSFSLDEQGMGSFGVVPNGDHKAELTLSQHATLIPPLLFRDAKNDQNPALTYGYTTGAAADDPSFGPDTSYCSVYVKVDPSRHAKNVHVTLDGGAYVLGQKKAHAQNAEVPLLVDGTATFQIVDKVDETINVNLDLKDGTPETTFQITFKAFPSWRKRHPWVITGRRRNRSYTTE
ncbi:hypothetical protein C9I57_27695 [Trinickia symbiotica]|uniref:Uncharacterized protein n=1 Tax=Trinickia symbiotica TaxID=863227 RepID=A0A2T3XLT2_9BURK|nr:hypothetical protein [Trinickia symbiotica]PTB17475.1 hypothetical protein C9I57_27695 [Trinickia symbiotica]